MQSVRGALRPVGGPRFVVIPVREAAKLTLGLPPGEEGFLDLLGCCVRPTTNDDGHAGAVHARQLDDGGVEQRIVALQFVNDSQWELPAQLVLAVKAG